MIKIITKFENIKNIAKKIAKIKNVKAVYLFGSYARKEQHGLSDIDLCVIGDLSEKEELEIMGYCTDNLDVSAFNQLPIYIKIRVFREGKTLVVKDTKYLDYVKLKTIKEYLDYKPLINKYIREALNV